ncbi:exodeoxyribonuclease III [Candidatus Marinamargulisbacteria bacterium SCGC AG-439-L15]|nr:exodeoxyribonuclease III [Candidatus Marinamargulisbacteria bacterium SCGC AG-439-L15]
MKNMKIISWNVNGIRACVKKGFLEYLKNSQVDMICLQETKIAIEDLDDLIKDPPGYYGIWHSAERKGYSGTAILTKHKPLSVTEGFGNPKYDCEGRVTMAEYDDFYLFSVYFPNGQKDETRLQYKLEFYRDFFEYCEDLRTTGKGLVICGDYNTAHYPIDLARPKENEGTSGFLPIERDWMDKIVKMGYVDTFRLFNQDPNNYSWWSYRTRARERNIGWRIDYTFVNDTFKDKVSSAFIDAEILGSDHCPVGITLNLNGQ